MYRIEYYPDPINLHLFSFISSGSTTATSNEDVLNNASDSNSQDAEMSSPLHNHENNHSDNNVRSGNNGNSTEQTPEVTDETSNGPLKVCCISIDFFFNRKPTCSCFQKVIIFDRFWPPKMSPRKKTGVLTSEDNRNLCLFVMFNFQKTMFRSSESTISEGSGARKVF